MANINDEWELFMTKNDKSTCDDEPNTFSSDSATMRDNNSSAESSDASAPIASDIYISTKSKIAYLDKEIDIKRVFWDISVIPYHQPTNGVIKKQIKFNSNSHEELNFIQEKLKKEIYYQEHIITSIDNPTGRIKFKDIRKISVGISKKDIMSYRVKQKSAFYNCFVMIYRIKVGDTFKEFHIKVFNTGKIEIPGVQCDVIYEEVLLCITQILQPFMIVGETINYNKTSDTVLINSNFNCGFYINREKLVDILKTKYNIHCVYDPCSYPGIQCKFYYNPEKEVQTGMQISKEEKSLYQNIITVSFMIFRTGSILIVGMCDEKVLFVIYEFIKQLLKEEYNSICQNNITIDYSKIKCKNKKVRRKNILITTVEDEVEDT
jgi:hypothetical protein